MERHPAEPSLPAINGVRELLPWLSAGDLDELRYLATARRRTCTRTPPSAGTIAAILRIADCRRLFGWLGAEHRALELSARPEAQRPPCGRWWRPAG